eukprot:10025874-Prorocentrum_lima.AAC.1
MLEPKCVQHSCRDLKRDVLAHHRADEAFALKQWPGVLERRVFDGHASVLRHADKGLATIPIPHPVDIRARPRDAQDQL